METINEGKITKKEDGYIIVNGIICKLDKEQYFCTHIGDKVKLKLCWFKKWNVENIRFKNPLHRYLIGVNPI